MKKIIYILLILILSIGNVASQSPLVGRILIYNGTILEFQGGAYYDDGSLVPLGVLTQNAINAGYSNTQERYISQYEYSIWKKYGVYPPPSIAAIETLEQARIQQQTSDTQNLTEKATSKQDLQTKYQNQIDNLNTVVNNSNYIQAKTNWTNAEVISYMKVLAWNDEVLAKGQIAILRMLRWMPW